ncbi:MAG: hypothetical protein IT376_02355 [Polyangiaceae bacterium]|nr:hypothetical protein [Polyangiaceae bacterium]
MAAGRVELEPRALCRLIRAISPTGRPLNDDARRQAHALKARLQSAAIRQLEAALVVRRTPDARIVGLGLRREGAGGVHDDLGHARLDALDDDARARVRARLERR